jgi:hypothetical protein
VGKVPFRGVFFQPFASAVLSRGERGELGRNLLLELQDGCKEIAEFL